MRDDYLCDCVLKEAKLGRQIKSPFPKCFSPEITDARLRDRGMLARWVVLSHKPHVIRIESGCEVLMRLFEISWVVRPLRVLMSSPMRRRIWLFRFSKMNTFVTQDAMYGILYKSKIILIMTLPSCCSQVHSPSIV